MRKFIIRRLLLSIPVLFGVSVITFSIMQLAPGDPAAIMLGGDFIEYATEEDLRQAREALGVNRPAVVQYLDWLSGFFVGDLGTSLFTGKSVSELVGNSVEPTLAMVLTGLFMAVIVGIPSGVLAAWKANSWIDRAVMIFAVLGFSIPVFWLAFNLIWLFSLQLDVTPVIQYVSPTEDLVEFIKHLTLPAITLALAFMALIARMTRSSMLEVLREDYIRTARAKGLVERSVLIGHALKAASMPIVTVIGLVFSVAVTGSVLTETVFAFPGMGRLFVDAVSNRDFPVIQGLMMIYATAFVVINLVVDITYAYFDPRVRY